MKKDTNMTEWIVKGELYEIGENYFKTQIIKKDSTEEDMQDLTDFMEGILAFCNQNEGKNIEFKASIKVVDENK